MNIAQVVAMNAVKDALHYKTPRSMENAITLVAKAWKISRVEAMRRVSAKFPLFKIAA